MRNSPLTFKRLSIIRMPGFPTSGFNIDRLGPHLNVIYGPNAAGKSITAKAIRSLLWPSKAADRDESSGLFELEDAEWQVNLQSRKVTCLRNGESFKPPLLVAEEQSDSYYLSLPDLLRSEDKDFARRIAQEAAGGYDVAAAAKKLGFEKVPPIANIAEYKTLRDKLKTWKDVQAKESEIVDEASRLDELLVERNYAELAGRRARLLKIAAKYVRIRDDQKEKAEAILLFDPRVQRLKGNEESTLEELKTRRLDKEERAQKAQETAAQVQRKIDDTALPDGGVPQPVISAAEDYQKDLINAENQYDNATRTADVSAAAVVEARAAIGEHLTDSQLEAVTEPGSWEQQINLARRAEALRGEQSGLDSFRQWLKAGGAQRTDTSTLEQGISSLHGWLDAVSEPASGGWIPEAILAAILLAAVGVALGIQWLVLVPLAVSGIAVFVWLLLWKRGENPERMRRRREFDALRLEQPEEWTVDAVLVLVRKLRAQLHQSEYANSAFKRLDETDAKDGELAKQAAILAGERTDLEARLGVAVGSDESSLALLAEQVKKWRDARSEMTKARADKDNAGALRDNLLSQINEALRPYCQQTAADSTTAQALLQEVRRRAEEYRGAVAEREVTNQQEEDARSEIQRISDSERELYEDAGVPVGDEQTMAQLIRERGEYLNAVSERETAAALKDAARTELQEVAEHNRDALLSLDVGGWSAPDDADQALEELTSKAVDELETEFARQEENGDRLVALNHQVSQIMARVEDAKTRHPIERALQEVENARTDLRRHRDERCALAVGAELAEYVDKKSREESQPEVLKRATDYFSAITHGRYELRFSENSFNAWDTKQSELKRLEELSDGTRVQLLLSVRLGFVEAQERGPMLPLLLDETLATSDDERAVCITDAIAEICATGRQVFYFTAQADEMEKLRLSVKRFNDSHLENEIDFRITDLGKVVQ